VRGGIVRRAIVAAAASALLAARPGGASASLPPATLTGAAISSAGGAVELHFAFYGIAPRWTLATHGDQLWIDLPHTRSRVPPRPLFGEESAPIKAVRIIDRGAGRARIVVEVEGKTDYAIARLRHQIVLRVAPAGTVPNLASPLLARAYETQPSSGARDTDHRSHAAPRQIAGSAPARSAPAELRSAAPQFRNPIAPELTAAPGAPLPAHPLVMIDPGHGGYDPGTMSDAGVREADLALQIATRVQRALEQRGIRARMTRTADVFIPLPDRTRIANRANADLFLSIHLNSSPNPRTAGIEVYYLNNTTDRATIRLARMENGGAAMPYGTRDGANLNYILTDLRQQYKATAAASLARMIDAQTVADLDAGLGINVNALGAKKGPFYVLVGANMPAVLVECGFLSNSGEALRLASPQYQNLLADGIATAIARYFDADAAVGNL
jgi:N-acetylmuramoyl-L-alanine amidase